MRHAEPWLTIIAYKCATRSKQRNAEICWCWWQGAQCEHTAYCPAAGRDAGSFAIPGSFSRAQLGRQPLGAGHQCSRRAQSLEHRPRRAAASGIAAGQQRSRSSGTADGKQQQRRGGRVCEAGAVRVAAQPCGRGVPGRRRSCPSSPGTTGDSQQQAPQQSSCLQQYLGGAGPVGAPRSISCPPGASVGAVPCTTGAQCGGGESSRRGLPMGVPGRSA